MLTGSTPHDIETTLVEALHRVAFEERREPQALEPALPRQLCAILAKATEAAPARRYASAQEFAVDLRRWLAGDPVEAQPPGRWRRGVRWIARHPILTTGTLSIMVGLAILGGSLALTWWWTRQADRLAISPDHDEVTLTARSGAVVHRWETQDTESVFRFADIFDLPKALGGGAWRSSASAEPPTGLQPTRSTAWT